jgi:hypothetical protein
MELAFRGAHGVALFRDEGGRLVLEFVNFYNVRVEFDSTGATLYTASQEVEPFDLVGDYGPSYDPWIELARCVSRAGLYGRLRAGG